MIKRLLKRNGTVKDGAQPLGNGTIAPDFSLPSSTGERISLDDLRGSPAVLVFYPADESPVCSNQLALYNEALPLFREYKAQVLGISVDDLDSHKAFANSLNLSIPLLSDNDPKGDVARAFGVYHEDDGVSERAIFVLDRNGVIAWSHLAPRSVNPGANGILEALESMKEPTTS